MAKTILFGPFFGEYGWEFARFQPSVRHCCEKNPKAHTIIMSTPGHQHLYPFCDEFWPLPEYIMEELEHNGVYRETARIWFKGANSETKSRVKQKQKQLKQEVSERLSEYDNVEWKNGKEMSLRYKQRSGKKLDPVDTSWSDRLEKPYLCISYRNRGINDKGNWSIQNWCEVGETVCKQLNFKAWVVLGTPDEIEEFTDVVVDQEDNLARSIDLLSNCDLSITPESGSGFLSTLCGAPTVIFGHSRLENRYTKEENFTNAPTKFIGNVKRKFSPNQIINESVRFYNGSIT